jgi:hypothetical protein
LKPAELAGNPPTALDGVCDCLDCIILPHHPLVQLIRKVEQLLLLTGHQLGHGDACTCVIGVTGSDKTSETSEVK